jgi:hypothetical protein
MRKSLSVLIPKLSTSGQSGVKFSRFQVESPGEFKITYNVFSLEVKGLKGLLHKIFKPVYWPVWMQLGLNKNRFWFLNFEEAPSIWGSHFKFWCVSVQTFSEILRISENDWQLRTQLPIPLRELGNQLPTLLRELGNQLPIILGDSTILREIFSP